MSMLTRQWLDVLESYHLALKAWSHAEKAGEPDALVKHLAAWRDRERDKLSVVLREVALAVGS